MSSVRTIAAAEELRSSRIARPRPRIIEKITAPAVSTTVLTSAARSRASVSTLT